MSKPPKVPRAVSQYMRELGKRGGKATGKSKRRGSSDYYRQLIAKRWHKTPPKE